MPTATAGKELIRARAAVVLEPSVGQGLGETIK